MTLFRSGNRSVSSGRSRQSFFSILALGAVMAFFAVPAQAQQTGDISGFVTDAGGNGINDVTIEASSNVLPQPRTTRTADNGRYRFRLLPPGQYTVEFTLPDGSSQTRNVLVLLQQTAELNIVSGGAMEEIIVTGEQLAVDAGQGSLSDAISASTIDAIPVGQDYRDIMKLIPGVQYSELDVRGPSSGGSGQDNVYLFDGVDVSLPLFGVLASEPSSHDIAQVSIVRGGAKAVGFNRSGGFTMNTISKRGTDEFKAEVSYQVQSSGLTSDQDTGSSLEFDEDRTWVVANFGGPLLRDRLYFYTSYYAPERTRDNSSNAYGAIGDFDSTRDEYFAKLTFSPTDNILLDASYRTSDRENKNESIGQFEHPSVSVGSSATQDILILEGSWIVTDDSSLSFKYIDWEDTGSSRPDNLFGFIPQQGGSLDIANLDQMGYIDIPIFRDPDTQADIDFNNFIAPYVAAYSHDPVLGGGAVGGYHQIDSTVYTRESFEVAFDHTLYIGEATHDLHFGYQWMEVAEDLARRSNGWGLVDILGGISDSPNGTPAYFVARVQQQSLLSPTGEDLIPSIYSSSEMQSIEINDTITKGDFTWNVGVLISNDILYGQGLAPDTTGMNTLTGLMQSPGTPYKMYEVDWEDMIQPRLGMTWDFSDTSSFYLNYARYNPSASSLARAASWDRNLRSRIDVFFDANGNFIESETVDSSSGKWFQDGLEPRLTEEFIAGITKDFSDELSFRAHVRHRIATNFWEDTGNADRINYPHPGEPLPPGVPAELYVPNLDDIRAEIGGSSYVIAQLDGGKNKFWEASFEADWSHENWFVHGSYTWSHYYGNFDQDVTTTFNDQATFIGSSNIGDGPGRQLWNLKYGNLGGDRRHMLKLYGYYQFPWDGRAGAYLVYQSGEPWETWDRFVYASQTGSSSDTIKYAEPAGLRTSDDHYQLDLNYTHNFRIGDVHNIQLRADIYNVFDNQTGYNIHRDVNDSGYGQPDSYYRPRRIQLAVKYQFQ